jgi:hypothetical protein
MGLFSRKRAAGPGPGSFTDEDAARRRESAVLEHEKRTRSLTGPPAVTAAERDASCPASADASPRGLRDASAAAVSDASRVATGDASDQVLADASSSGPGSGSAT